jgi:hypothetical protein
MQENESISTGGDAATAQPAEAATTPPEITSPSPASPATPHPAEDTPMLDVHPPHEAVHTWKDFCIHIIAIVIGLLIAVGLEQTVEYIHHRSQVAETRAALQREHDMNVKLFAVKVEEFRRFTPILQTDLAVFQYLQQHPGAPEKDWPGRLSWYNLTWSHEESAWQTAKQANALELMPQAEVQRDTDLYRRLQQSTDFAAAVRSDVYEARSFTINDPDASHLTPAQLAREIDLVNKALLDQMLGGAAQFNMHKRFAEFSAPTGEELSQILRGSIDPKDYQAVGVLVDKIVAIHDTGEADSPESSGTR